VSGSFRVGIGEAEEVFLVAARQDLTAAEGHEQRIRSRAADASACSSRRTLRRRGFSCSPLASPVCQERDVLRASRPAAEQGCNSMASASAYFKLPSLSCLS